MSGVNDDCYVHYYRQQQNTSIANETFLSTLAPVTRQLAQGGSEGQHQCQSTIVGGACQSTIVGGACQSKIVGGACQSTIVGGAWVCVMSHIRDSEYGLIWERGYYLSGLKKHWVDFYHYRVFVCKHCQHTYMIKQHVKVNFASSDPFKIKHVSHEVMVASLNREKIAVWHFKS